MRSFSLNSIEGERPLKEALDQAVDEYVRQKATYVRPQ